MGRRRDSVVYAERPHEGQHTIRRRARVSDHSRRSCQELGALVSRGLGTHDQSSDFGCLSIATQDASCNQGFIVFPPDARFPPSYIYEWLTAQAHDLEMIATGATFKEITKGALKRFPMLVPTPDVLLRFDEVATPIGAEVEALESKNRRLAATRDLLLPRLVTGRLDISNVELGDLLLSEAR